MEIIFQAHSGLRYMVLLLAVIAIGYHAFGLATRRPVDGGARFTRTLFVGTLDVQIVLGLILMAMGIYYGALIGHLVMMLLAAVAAHVSGAVGRKAAEPRRYYTVVLTGLVVSLLLIVLGVAAIGRSVFQSGAPSIVG